jgi:hypothetical protein
MFAPCEVLAETLGGLFECSRVNRYTRIRTPFFYPDGDVIDLFLEEKNGEIILTDLGETLRWLSSQAVSEKRSKKQLELIQDVLKGTGVRQHHGSLQLDVRDAADFANTVTTLSQAALRIADVWFTFQPRSGETVVEEVEGFLRVKKIFFDKAPELRGHSGNKWKLDFYTRTARRNALVKVLHTDKKGSARRIAEHVLAGWVDLEPTRRTEQTKFISLFNDTNDVWDPEEYRLVETLSEVARWSRPEEFAEKLVA